MSDEVAPSPARRKYPPLPENTYIGAFLVGVGYYAAKCGQPAPVSALVQQSGQDPATGDLALDLSGRNYLFEFKRRGNTKGLKKEADKSTSLWTKLADKHQTALLLGTEDEGKRLLEISRQCHIFSLSGITWERKQAPPWKFRPYLEFFPPPADHALATVVSGVARAIDLPTFVRNSLFPDPTKASPASARMRGASGTEFSAYIDFLQQTLAGETGQLGGLVINIDDSGHITPVIFENLADLTPEKGMLLIASEAPPEPSPPQPSIKAGPKPKR